MRILLLTLMLLITRQISSQGFECDGSFYMVIYTQSVGKSTLYKIKEDNFRFDYEAIELSEDRRLTALSYNVNNKLLTALDADTYELISINRDGQLSNIGVPDNINKDLIFSSGSFTAEGGGMVLFGYDALFERDTEIVNINLGRAFPYAGSLGVTGSHPVQIMDLATDPLTGAIYAFDKLRGTMIQISIGGGTSSLDYPVLDVNSIDALFFNQKGQLFGYSPSTGMYAFDKGNGAISSLGKIPEGTHADGCSCPYTYEFEKTILPKKIVECEPFTVEYKFSNRMGVGQIIDEFRDTFPEGFEIINVESDLISTFTDVDLREPNILSINTFIYLLGENTIHVTVKPPSNFLGAFSSSGIQGDFPLAFGEYILSDDPDTETLNDPTFAEVISENEIDFTDYISYSCNGKEATIESPISSENYLWSDGSTESTLVTSETGWYSLQVQNECVTYFDSVEISSFPDARYFELGEDRTILLGDTLSVNLDVEFLKAEEIEWYFGDSVLTCSDCSSIMFSPTTNGVLKALVIDADGCNMESRLEVNVQVKREVYQPNVFSPNGDGLNDYFYLSTAIDAVVTDFKIYNRWGNLVFSKSDFPSNVESEGWDGTYTSRKLHSNIFVYVAELEYPDGFKSLIKGEVLILTN